MINICSVVSHEGYPMQGAYSAAKHALLGYTKVLARETFDQASAFTPYPQAAS